MVMLQELFSLLITSCASKVASSLRTLWLVRNMLIQYQIILRQNRFFCNVSVEDRKLTPERVILLLDIRTGVPSPTYVFLLVFLFFITIKELFAVGGQVLLKSLLSTLNNPSLQLLNKPSMEEERFVVPVDPFASDIFYGVDLESFELQEERPKKRRRRSVKKVAKQDIRRHFSKVFISAVNSNGGKTIETFFNTFMKHGCKVHLEVPNKEQQEEEVTLVAEGPYKSSFFALGLGIMYPDMILSENSCQLFTSNIWNGTKIVLNFKFVGTPIFCLSLPRAVELMNSLYVNDVDNTSQSSFSYNSQSDNGSESGNSSLASEAGSKSSKKSRRESTTSTTLGADSPLTAKVRAMFHQVPLLVDPKEISLLWTMTIILDPHNMMEQVHVALSDEQV